MKNNYFNCFLFTNNRGCFIIFFGESLYKSMYRIPGHEERLRFLVQQVERMTGLQNFGVYMDKLLTIDAFS